jgi:flagellar motor switch protein FliN/FliY
MTPIEQLGRLGSIPLPVDVSLSCGMMAVREVLELKPGMVIRSQRSAGDNLDVHVGGRLVAYGEVVALEGPTGVRVTNLKEQA